MANTSLLCSFSPLLRVSLAVPVSLESGTLVHTSCVKHAAQPKALAGQAMCLDWLWAVLG